MAGELREFAMPNGKRDRIDAQDDLWNASGLKPLEGKMEDDRAEAARKKRDDIVEKKAQKLDEQGVLNDEEVKDAQAGYLLAAAAAFESRKKSESLKKTIEFAERILSMGASVLHEFIGMLGTRLADRDVRKYYVWKSKECPQQNLLEVEGVNSIEELVQKNRHLGKEVLRAIVEQYTEFDPSSPFVSPFSTADEDYLFSDDVLPPLPPVPAVVKVESQLIGPLFTPQQGADTTALDRLLSSEDDGGFVTGEKRQWVFGALDLAAFEHILSVGSIGAMSLALGMIHRIRGCERFSLKQLLLSEGVRDIFAIFVAFQYVMTSGGNAYAGRASTMGSAKGTTYMLSAGLETRRMLFAQIETAQYWFQDVYEAPNPMYQQVENQIRAVEQAISQLKPQEAFVRAVEKKASLLNVHDMVLLLKRQVDIQAARNTVNHQTVQYLKKCLELYRLKALLPSILPKILVHAN